MTAPSEPDSVDRAFDYFYDDVHPEQRDALRNEFAHEDRTIAHDALLGEVARLRNALNYESTALDALQRTVAAMQHASPELVSAVCKELDVQDYDWVASIIESAARTLTTPTREVTG